MKKILIVSVICLLAGYLIFSVFYFQGKSDSELCAGLKVEIRSKNGAETFLDGESIQKYIKEKGLDPTGKYLGEVNTDTIEEVIMANHLIKEADVFITNDGLVKVTIEERVPVLRVIPDGAASYYVDKDGTKMPLSNKVTAYLPVATGAINEEFAIRDLYKFALFLQNDEFWNAQIEQIVVLPNKDIRLVPRVGDHQIILGKLNDYETRLNKLLVFYKNGLNETGWNKYSVINLKFDKQVVCTKR